MEPEGVPALLEALFTYCKSEVMLDKRTKANLRLCNKHFKNLVDATVIAASVPCTTLRDTLNPLNNTEWPDLMELRIWGSDLNPLTELPSALFVKFSRLETLEIVDCMCLTALPEEIGELSHLMSLELTSCYSLLALPSSLGKLTTLEKICLIECPEMAVEGLAPLQHLTGLTSLELNSFQNAGKMIKYPDFICNLPLLKELKLYSHSIKTLPAALGNLTNLEHLEIWLGKLQKLPESIGNLNALKRIDLKYCSQLTTLPESLDDLLWRKAHETGESKMRQVVFPVALRSKISPKMKQTLELMKHNGVIVSYQ